MEVREELLPIAEIAIGIAGFTGVIAAFLQRGGLHRVDRVRFVNLFVAAFITLLLAYVPIVVSHLVADAARIWTYSSAVMVVVWFLNVAFACAYVIPSIRADFKNDAAAPTTFIAIPPA